MANLARFTINATPSSSPGFDGSVSQALTFALESVASLVQQWTLSVTDVNDTTSPASSKSAPPLSLVGATTGQKVNAATPASSITTTLPASGVHSWIVRSQVNGGKNPDGSVNPDYTAERMVVIKTGSGLRKIVYAESTQYGTRGWADAQNDLIDAGAGPLLAPGGAANANKIAAADGAGTNLQYAASVKLAGGGTALAIGVSPAPGGALRLDNGAQIVWNSNPGGTNIVGVQVSSGGVVTIGDSAAVNNGVEVQVGGANNLDFKFANAFKYRMTPTALDLFANNLNRVGDLDHDGSNLGFYGTAPTSKKAVTGSKGGNAALTSLMTQLAAIGLFTDSTT